MRKLLPVLLAIVGIGAGIGAGLAFKPAGKDASHAAADAGDHAKDDGHGDDHGAKDDHSDDGQVTKSSEYVRMNNQFVVPLVRGERVAGLVVLSISVEVAAGRREDVFAVEPKLRDVFLQVMFDHADVGGFEGRFTSAASLDPLRRNLLAVAQRVLGPDVSDVLITDIARQDA